MKLDLATAVAAAIIGVVVAYVACNLFLPAIEDFSFKVIDASSSYALSEPNEDIFNFRAVNPTVEVYVGQCTEYNEDGECIDYGGTVEVVVGGDEEETSEDADNSSNSTEGASGSNSGSNSSSNSNGSGSSSNSNGSNNSSNAQSAGGE
ncbi:hypothetical protein IKE79_02110 [Candidatus Saccharibacteria bacterium]|nr:hypothetical protein [Candidatus Saccharibacteria bacterium]